MASVFKTTKSSSTNGQSLGDKAFKGAADLIKLLPTGTVFLFQFLSPLATDSGHCGVVNKYLTGALLVICGFSCCFSCFTDSYVDTDGKCYYGMVTKTGLWLFSDPNTCAKDLSKYRLRLGDFVHALLSVVVFAVIALLDTNTMSCFYPSLITQQKTLAMVLPSVIGGAASSVFMVFPNNRHGIGYAPSSSETTADQNTK